MVAPGIPIALEFSKPPLPLEVYLYLKKKRIRAYWLDSARFHPVTGRYSFIGFDPEFSIKSRGEDLPRLIPTLRGILKEREVVSAPDLPPFIGGAIGYFGYDVGRLFETLPCQAVDDLHLAESEWIFVRTVIAWDHLAERAWIIEPFHPERESRERHQEINQRLCRFRDEIQNDQRSLQSFSLDEPILLGEIQHEMNQKEFEEMVLKAKEYIGAGEIYQANLSQRLWCSIEGDPFLLYWRLREINPSPFSCFLPMSEVTIVGCSPERLVRLQGNKAETRPIAGTRPRGAWPEEDLQLRTELLLNPKERAEHIMLVDLERNDLGRVCEYGSVEVNDLMVIEEYSHVRHIVSNVQGKLLPGRDRFDLIAATFPGGTITGTPKIRAIQIIDELEPIRRQIYTGSVGYLSYSGTMDLNIVIRTFLITHGRAFIQVGAGIVADSIPEREYQETLDKAEALVEAVRLFEVQKVPGSFLQKRTRYFLSNNELMGSRSF